MISVHANDKIRGPTRGSNQQDCFLEGREYIVNVAFQEKQLEEPRHAYRVRQNMKSSNYVTRDTETVCRLTLS
ncbi:hypothetical protein BOTNAR_0069g00320 [Botryotinia narcissicola]|uniref:Uncharacterized protein n=1 Tax=Botryotinia narcissicola TaxID=278944 RepID=A0A4Z1J395_9HELO|nr:hypothetical protein BOTNAR_0069g00320 [Botryotinia narcissicola]